MKQLFFLSVLFSVLFLSTRTGAQTMRVDPSVPHTIKVKDSIPKAKIGVKIGAASNRLSGNLSFNQAYTTGLNAGGFMEIRKKKIGLQVEAMISTAKHQVRDTLAAHIDGGSLSFIYLDIPVIFELKVLPFLWLQAGPQIGTMVSVTQSPGTSLDPKSIFQSNNFSGVIGLEAKLPYHFTLGARYIAGFSNINNGNVLNPGEPWKTSNIQVYVGLMFL